LWFDLLTPNPLCCTFYSVALSGQNAICEGRIPILLLRPTRDTLPINGEGERIRRPPRSAASEGRQRRKTGSRSTEWICAKCSGDAGPKAGSLRKGAIEMIVS